MNKRRDVVEYMLNVADGALESIDSAIVDAEQFVANAGPESIGHGMFALARLRAARKSLLQSKTHIANGRRGPRLCVDAGNAENSHDDVGNVAVVAPGSR